MDKVSHRKAWARLGKADLKSQKINAGKVAKIRAANDNASTSTMFHSMWRLRTKPRWYLKMKS